MKMACSAPKSQRPACPAEPSTCFVQILLRSSSRHASPRNRAILPDYRLPTRREVNKLPLFRRGPGRGDSSPRRPRLRRTAALVQTRRSCSGRNANATNRFGLGTQANQARGRAQLAILRNSDECEDLQPDSMRSAGIRARLRLASVAMIRPITSSSLRTERRRPAWAAGFRSARRGSSESAARQRRIVPGSETSPWRRRPAACRARGR